MGTITCFYSRKFSKGKGRCQCSEGPTSVDFKLIKGRLGGYDMFFDSWKFYKMGMGAPWGQRLVNIKKKIKCLLESALEAS